jgi:dienelactone hydrolase
VDSIACRSDPSQTYAVYLPAAYDPARAWPLLFVFDPRSRGTMAAEIFRDAAEEHGWILASSNNTMSDGPWDPNERAVNAMWPDVMERFAVDPRRVYAAGFSGGAMLSWLVAQSNDQVAGIIAAGGRLPQGFPTAKTGYAHFGAAGRTDFNYAEMTAIDELVAKRGDPHRLEVFEGRHQWLPPELAAVAVRWLEVLAMAQGRRPADAAFVERAWEADLAAAREAEEAGDRLAALRRWRALAETYAPLRDVAPARARLEALEADPGTARAVREETRWLDWERNRAAEAHAALGLLDDPERPTVPARLESALGLRQLTAQAAAEGPEGDAAGRVLASVYAQLSFYRPRDYFAAHRYRDAATALTVAAGIQPLPHVLYNLGAAEARLGHGKKALEALERAVEAGWADADHLAADEDFASLRDDGAFRALLTRLRAAPAP